LAVTFKQTAMLETLAAAVAVLAVKSALPRALRLRALGLMFLGGVLVLVVVLGVMTLTHQGAEFWQNAVMSLVHGAGKRADAGGVLRMYLLEKWFPQLVPLWLLAAWPWLSAPRRLGASPLERVLQLWLVFSLVGAVGRGTIFGHQGLVFIPALAGLAGLGAAWLGQQWSALPWTVRVARLAFLLVVIVTPWATAWEVGMEKHSRAVAQGGSAVTQLARYLGRTLPAGETIYTPELSEMYIVTQRLAPTRYFSTATWGVDPEEDRRRDEEVLSDLLRHPPGAVVLEERPSLKSSHRVWETKLLQGHYVPLLQLGAVAGHDALDVYVRGDLGETFRKAPLFAPPGAMPLP
jgi:hypothetical protein